MHALGPLTPGRDASEVLSDFDVLDVLGAEGVSERASVVDQMRSRKLARGEDSAAGCVLGMAVGDAIGAPNEFKVMN